MPHSPDIRDEFPQTPARNAVVAVVRGYGAVQRLMEPYFAGFGVTPPQFQVLTIVNRLKHEDLSQRRLARELYVSFPNITVILTRMEQQKLIRRQTNPGDRREKFVRLTSKGRALLFQIWKVHQAQLDKVMVGLTDRERSQLAWLLNKMIEGQTELVASEQAGPTRRKATRR